MEFQNLIEKRRSVRKYVERNTVTKDEILSMIKQLRRRLHGRTLKQDVITVLWTKRMWNSSDGNVCRK